MGPVGNVSDKFFNILTMVLVLLFIFVKEKDAETDMTAMNSEQLIRHWGYEAETHLVTTEDGYILEQHRIGHGRGRPFIIQHGLGSSSEIFILGGPKKDLEIIRYWGYEPETHSVTTEDGYILDQHRIGHGKGRPFIIQHGLAGTSEYFILRGPKKDWAFLLADAGYDVWVTNCRGNNYGRRHVSLSPNSEKFWDFSWHEMGYYDMPAIIDHILNVTGHSKVMYVGHSMGTTISYVLGSTRPEYNDKLALVFSWAPSAYVYHVWLRDWIRPLASIAKEGGEQLKKQGIHGILPRQIWIGRLLAGLCDKRAFQAICLFNIFFSAGFDFEQIEPDLLPRYLAHTPSGTSFKAVEHYAQTYLTGDFQMYDYGKKKNLELYGRKTPPSYNMSLMTSPVVLYYSYNDHLSSVKDVNRLASKLPNLVGKIWVPHKNFNHLDYVWARDVKKLVYDSMFTIMKKYEPAE